MKNIVNTDKAGKMEEYLEGIKANREEGKEKLVEGRRRTRKWHEYG